MQFADYLLGSLGRGAMSRKDLQEAAHSVVLESHGNCSKVTKSIANIATHGQHPQNAERDLFRLLSLPCEPWHIYSFWSYFCFRKRKDTIILKHRNPLHHQICQGSLFCPDPYQGHVEKEEDPGNETSLDSTPWNVGLFASDQTHRSITSWYSKLLGDLQEVCICRPPMLQRHAAFTPGNSRGWLQVYVGGCKSDYHRIQYDLTWSWLETRELFA